MASSGIGGQAVMEGVMMRKDDRYAVAVRKPDQTIAVEVKEYHSFCKIEALRKIPVLRGIINFVDSLVLGMGTLAYSASFFEEEQEEKNQKKEKVIMGFTMFLAVILAIAIFTVLPFGISLLFQKAITSKTVVILLEGVIRLVIFFAYLLLISRMKDIQRVFMYHGAEHKCINCIEHGMELNVENVRKSSREHKRCGTSFLFFVVIISVIATLFIRVDSRLLRLVLRLAVIPLVAGVSYEFIRLAGRSENPVINFLSKPGLLMQKLTTREPEDDMIEVGIASVEAVFDWKAYIDDLGAHKLQAAEQSAGNSSCGEVPMKGAL